MHLPALFQRLCSRSHTTCALLTALALAPTLALVTALTLTPTCTLPAARSHTYLRSFSGSRSHTYLHSFSSRGRHSRGRRDRVSSRGSGLRVRVGARGRRSNRRGRRVRVGARALWTKQSVNQESFN